MEDGMVTGVGEIGGQPVVLGVADSRVNDGKYGQRVW